MGSLFFLFFSFVPFFFSGVASPPALESSLLAFFSFLLFVLSFFLSFTSGMLASALSGGAAPDPSSSLTPLASEDSFPSARPPGGPQGATTTGAPAGRRETSARSSKAPQQFLSTVSTVASCNGSKRPWSSHPRRRYVLHAGQGFPMNVAHRGQIIYLELEQNTTWWLLCYFSHMVNIWSILDGTIFRRYNGDLVGGIPSPPKNMSSSVGIISPNIWKNFDVPNHQPVIYIYIYG